MRRPPQDGRSLVLLFGGPTRYPGNIYIPGMFVPLSAFPVAVISAIAHDPTGPSTTPGAAEARFQVRIPFGAQGDFVLQAVVLDTTIHSSMNNSWTLSNGMRIQF